MGGLAARVFRSRAGLRNATATTARNRSSTKNHRIPVSITTFVATASPNPNGERLASSLLGLVVVVTGTALEVRISNLGVEGLAFEASLPGVAGTLSSLMLLAGRRAENALMWTLALVADVEEAELD